MHTNKVTIVSKERLFEPFALKVIIVGAKLFFKDNRFNSMSKVNRLISFYFSLYLIYTLAN